MRRLLLVNDKRLYQKNNDILIEDIYLTVPKLLRLIRYLHFKLNIFNNLKHIWYGVWKKHLSEFNHIVVYDSLFGYEIFKYIREKNRNELKVALCYRNLINCKAFSELYDRNPLNIDNSLNIELWSFDLDDCVKYNMKYYDQFCLLSKKNNDLNSKIVNDVFFIGKDKGRLNEIIKLKAYCSLNNINAILLVVADKGKKYSKTELEHLSDWISYEEIISMINQTKCILEINQKGQKGLTYRAIEAMFLNKKLITNNIHIKDFEFYNKNNIFIIGLDEISCLKDFIISDYVSINDNIINRYSFQTFLNNIYKKNE